LALSRVSVSSWPYDTRAGVRNVTGGASMTGFSDNLFEVDRAEDVPVGPLREAIERRTFACIRGVIPEATVQRALELINEQFDHRRDHPTTGQPPSAVRTNFQILKVGGESISASNDDARLFRAFYNPFWEDDIYALRAPLTELARVRNVITDLPIDFALTRVEDNGLWTAARFHQYPAGGGFFRRHTDYIAKDVAEEKSVRFHQVVLTMSRKGDDYEQGGAFVDIDGERLFIDDESVPGDILVYDGRTIHGVEDIDPLRPLDLTTINGRLAGFATLFKRM